MLEEAFLNGLMQLIGESTRVLYELRENVRPDDLTPLQHSVLELLFYKQESSTVGQMAHCMNLTMPNMSREISKLVKKGYLIKEKNEIDRRVYSVFLTPKGQSEMSKAFEKIQINANKRWHAFSKEDQVYMEKRMKELTDKLFYR